MTAVENLTTRDGSYIFDQRSRKYLHAVRLAGQDAIGPWHASRCPECGDEPHGDGLVLCDDGMHAHVILYGSVVLGCEGYFTIDPAALGLDPGQWEDYRKYEITPSWAMRPHNAN